MILVDTRTTGCDESDISYDVGSLIHGLRPDQVVWVIDANAGQVRIFYALASEILRWLNAGQVFDTFAREHVLVYARQLGRRLGGLKRT